MTSIIGYTRIPCSSSKQHFSITPVKQILDQSGKGQTYRHIFSRGEKTNGIIELINNKQKKPQEHDKELLKNDYDFHLCIELGHYYDQVTTTNASNSADLQLLINSISIMAQKKTIQFVQVINLLKRLQPYQNQYQFMTCIDKQHERILIYFPNTITQIDQWLKQNIEIDIAKYNWQLLPLSDNNKEPTTITSTTDTSYFHDIHLFIKHVDSLIEKSDTIVFSKKKSTT